MKYFAEVKKQQGLSAILKTARSIVITPISYKEGEEGHKDYVREMNSYVAGFSVMWDDAPTNDSRAGDLFAFVTGQSRSETTLKNEGMPGGYCQIRRIIAVFDDQHRPSKDVWSIKAHAGRHVLVLSDILFEGSWVELCEACGKTGWGKEIGTEKYASPRQGTKRWKLNGDVIDSDES